MKNDRYLEEAIKNICDERHPVIDQNIIKSTFIAIYDECQAIAYANSETIDFNIDEEVLYKLLLLAHEKDVTLNEIVIESLELAILEAEKDTPVA